MKTYSIGEAITRFDKPTDIAYVFEGDAKGTVIYIDTINGNRLTSINENLETSQAFYISMDFNKEREEGRNILFANELTGSDFISKDTCDYAIEAINTINSIHDTFNQEVSKLSPEDQQKISEIISSKVAELL